MSTVPTLADLLAHRRRAAFVGRERELGLLQTLTAPDGPAIAYLHGPYGMGKSALLDAFESRVSARGISCLRLTGGAVEPQPDAMLAALADVLDSEGRALAEIVQTLADRELPWILIIDDADALQLVAAWLRRHLIPALPATARLILAGRRPPPSVWGMEYGELFVSIPLRPLAQDAVLASARDAGLDAETGDKIWRIAGGHPLSLRMALQAARAGVLDAAHTAGALAGTLLAGISDAALQRMVEAAAVVRRSTRPIMTAVLDDEGLEGFEAFAALPFVQLDREGYYLAEPVRRALADRLAAIDPNRHTDLRRTAAAWITRQLHTAGPAERWRYMADLLHLVEHPQVRDAFFPSDTPAPPVEPAEREDFAAIFAICAARAGDAERRIIEHWARVLPHRFSVARGPGGEVLAFYVYAHGDDAVDELAPFDALLASWLTHRAHNDVAGGTLFLRQLLAAEPGDARPERAACTLDVKRVYFERWNLARVYTAARLDVIEGPVMRRLGFRPLSLPRDGLPGSMVLELPGAGLVGWVSALVGVPAVPSAAATAFDFARDRREVTIDDRTVHLTRLEAGVLAMLIDHAPAVVTRDALIDTVWQRAFVGSNVVDAVMRTLRRKLGTASRQIATVPKAGYRLLSP